MERRGKRDAASSGANEVLEVLVKHRADVHLAGREHRIPLDRPRDLDGLASAVDHGPGLCDGLIAALVGSAVVAGAACQGKGTDAHAKRLQKTPSRQFCTHVDVLLYE